MKATQLAEEAERIRLAQDIHDEFGSGLTKIKFISDVVIQKNIGEEGELKKMLTPISNTATHLIDNMRDLIWVLNPSNNTLDILVARIREYAVDYLADFGIEVKFEMEDNFPTITVSKEVHRNLLMVLKEALQNIAKHSKTEKARIAVSITDHLKLEIGDFGQGFEVDSTKENGYGQSNMAKRMERIGADFKVHSVSGKGTLISVLLPRASISKIQNTTKG